MKKVLTVFLVLLIVAVILAGCALYLGYTVTNGNTNVRYVYVGDTNVSGLTRDETENLLIERGWQAKAETPLVVTTYRDVSFEVEPLRAGTAVSVDTLVDAAFAYGHNDEMITNLITAVRTMLHPVDVSRRESRVDTAYLDALIDACEQKVNENLAEEEYTVDPHAGEMTLVKGWQGLHFDRADFRAAIIAALESGSGELHYTKLAEEPAAPDFEAIHRELEREPADAYYTDDGTFNVVDEIVGCKFDVAEAQRLWDVAAPGETVTVPLDIVWPEVTGEQLRGQLYHDLLGACMTKFPNSAENRRSNLNLCASRINGYVLYPGETFSYNEVVGERTEEAGFLPAPAYVNGDVKDEIGGGACQVSSTLYAATAYAFLETVDRSCHVFPVNYMQMGTDATVTIPAEGKSIDFKFRNNKNFPIKIVTDFNDEERTISVEIWGTLEDDDYMPVEFDNTYGWTYDYDRFIDPAYPDREGYTIKFLVDIYNGTEEDGRFYYRTITHRQVIDQEGNIVDDTILNPGESGKYAMDTYYEHP